jgi:hypothetical protein
LGSWLLISSLTTLPDAHGFAARAPWLIQGVIRIVGILLQTVVCKERDGANAPFAFAAGLLIGGHAPLSAIFAIVLATTLAAGMRSPVVFFPVLAVCFAATAFLFGKKVQFVNSIWGAVAVSLPWLWSLLFSRELLISYRAKHPSSSRSQGSHAGPQ